MSRTSQRQRINHLVAIAAGLALAGGATLTTGVVAAAAAPAHAAKVTHHATRSTHTVTPSHKAKSTHKPAVHKKTSRTTRSVKVTHTKAPGHAKPTGLTVTPAPAPTPPPSAVAAPADCANVDLVPTSANLGLVRAATICLVNQQRAAAGLGALRENAALDAAAQAHSDDMVASDYFDHVAPTGSDMLSRIVTAGFATLDNVLDAGENIAAAGGSLATPSATVANWMASPDHRANILDPTFEQTGMGIAPGVPAMLGIGGSGATYTQTFGTAQ
jgi:uncharacterized protein YkwD